MDKLLEEQRRKYGNRICSAPKLLAPAVGTKVKEQVSGSAEHHECCTNAAQAKLFSEGLPLQRATTRCRAVRDATRDLAGMLSQLRQSQSWLQLSSYCVAAVV
eukprot:538641-Amphidinium_carterae.1